MRSLLRISFLVVGLTGLCWLTLGGVRQQRDEVAPESLVPKNAVLYWRYDGTEAHEPAIRDTAAWQSLEKTELRAKMFDLVRTIIHAGTGDEALAENVRTMINRCLSKGMTFAVTISPDGRDPAPYGMLVMHHSADRMDEIVELLKANNVPMSFSDVEGRSICSVEPPRAQVAMHVWAEGQHLVIGVGQDPAESIIENAGSDGDDVTDHPLWSQLRNSSEFTVDTFGWADLKSVREQFGNIPLPEPPNGAVITANDLLKLAGLHNLDSITEQKGFKGAVTWSNSKVHTTGERTGLMSLCDQKPLTLADLPPLPAKTQGFAAFRFDVRKAYDDVTDVVQKIVDRVAPPRDQFNVDEVVARFELESGLDVEALLDSIGDVHCIYQDPANAAMTMGVSFGVAVKVKDRTALAEQLETIAGLIIRESRGQVDVEVSESDGVTYYTIRPEGSPIAPAVMLTDDWLVTGILPATAQSFARRMAGTEDKWTPDAETLAALGELPQEFSGISWSDTKASYKSMMGQAPMLMSLLQFQMLPMMPNGDVGMPFTVADLPEDAEIVGPLFPNVAVSYSDANGIHSVTRNSAPSTPMGEVSSLAAIPILVALLLPAVQQAREAARRTQSRHNLKQITLGAHNYADTFGAFPAGTVVNEDLTTEERLAWPVHLLPFMEQQPMYEQIDRDKGWNTPAHRDLGDITIPTFLNPSSVPDPVSGGLDYAGVGGVGEDAPTLPRNHKRAGVFAYDQGTRFRDITDGASNTAMFGEINQGRTSWIRGGKGNIRTFSNEPFLEGPDGWGGNHTGVVQFAFADGSVRAISVNVDPTMLKALGTIAGGEIIDNDF